MAINSCNAAPRGRRRILRRALKVAFAATLAAGLAGSAHAQDASGRVWTLYRDFVFTAESDAIGDADRTKAREVADHLDRNPTYQIGLDGMSQARVSSVRDALLNAGIQPARIHAGAFGKPQMRGPRRVLVMIGR